MTTRSAPGLGLTVGWTTGESGWGAAMNGSLVLLSALAQASVKSRQTALPGSPAAGDMYIVPSGGDVNKIAIRDNGAWVYFVPFEGARVWVQDEDVIAVWTGATWKAITGAPFAIAGFSATGPTSSQILLDYLFVEDVTFADDFVGSRATVGTNPASTFTMDVRKNGVSVGSIQISSGGVSTFTTTGGTVSFSAGDLLTVVAPSSVDGSIARLRFTLKGLR